MARRKDNDEVKKSIFSLWFYLASFLLVAFVVTCSFYLFFSASDVVPEDVIRAGAKRTFINVFILSLLFTLIDGIRRKFTVERPVRQILELTRCIRRGEFGKRIPIRHSTEHRNEFDVIIDNLNIMAQELAGIETLRTDFVSNVSHELKTPLTVIQNYALMLQNANLPEEQRQEYAQNIMEASRRLTSLITNILKLNKLENQQIFPQTTAYNLSEQICACFLEFEKIWEQKEIDIVTEIEDDVMVEADAELLTLVWNNLFSNALKFTEPGGTVKVGLHMDGEMAEVIVSDTGCGIPADIGAHIFEKFYQGDTSHATQGNGLGLALVRRVVDIVGGDISVESEVGKGTSFRVRMKAAARDL